MEKMIVMLGEMEKMIVMLAGTLITTNATYCVRLKRNMFLPASKVESLQADLSASSSREVILRSQIGDQQNSLLFWGRLKVTGSEGHMKNLNVERESERDERKKLVMK
ncbi:hypothetical protein F2Q68_00022233 [Brassica cretica]|uniref:Uncharacterized protein n=1 Tax=Brassica cretica TaxID=69181 RepID=A0A8S9FUB7_BRACR|nr:hypothetical protein F2Q68_00022233 [Brassica cretica]